MMDTQLTKRVSENFRNICFMVLWNELFRYNWYVYTCDETVWVWVNALESKSRLCSGIASTPCWLIGTGINPALFQFIIRIKRRVNTTFYYSHGARCIIWYMLSSIRSYIRMLDYITCDYCLFVFVCICTHTCHVVVNLHFWSRDQQNNPMNVMFE